MMHVCIQITFCMFRIIQPTICVDQPWEVFQHHDSKSFKTTKNYTWFTTLETKRSNQHRCFFLLSQKVVEQVALRMLINLLQSFLSSFVVHDSKKKGLHTHRANLYMAHSSEFIVRQVTTSLLDIKTFDTDIQLCGVCPSLSNLWYS